VQTKMALLWHELLCVRWLKAMSMDQMTQLIRMRAAVIGGSNQCSDLHKPSGLDAKKKRRALHFRSRAMHPAVTSAVIFLAAKRPRSWSCLLQADLSALHEVH
jgi:hypothetical protein